MTLINSFYLRDPDGVAYGVKHVNNKPRVSAMDYLYDIAEGNISDHAPWTKIGYTPTMTTADSDLWAVAGVYVPPTVAMGMEVLSSDNTADRSTAIFSGTATGGTTTTLIDTGKDFTAGTAVVAGDVVVLEKAGAAPEWGIVTTVAATTLTVAGGFSQAGNANGRTYDVLDRSAFAGAQAVQISYLTSAFASKREIVLLNGTTVVATTNTDIYRVNAVRVIATGVNGFNTGTIDVRHIDNTPIYGRVNIGYTRGRNSFYTVPVDKTLYITEFVVGFGYAANQTHYARLYLRAQQYISAEGETFRTPGIFYPIAEVIVANASTPVPLDVPLRILSGVDLKMSGIATVAGIASCAMRGWLE